MQVSSDPHALALSTDDLVVAGDPMLGWSKEKLVAQFVSHTKVEIRSRERGQRGPRCRSMVSKPSQHGR